MKARYVSVCVCGNLNLKDLDLRGNQKYGLIKKDYALWGMTIMIIIDNPLTFHWN